MESASVVAAPAGGSQSKRRRSPAPRRAMRSVPGRLKGRNFSRMPSPRPMSRAVCRPRREAPLGADSVTKHQDNNKLSLLLRSVAGVAPACLGSITLSHADRVDVLGDLCVSPAHDSGRLRHLPRLAGIARTHGHLLSSG